MDLELKRKIREKTILELYLISLLAGTISLTTQQNHYLIQFTLTLTITAGITLLTSKITKKPRNSIYILISLIISLENLEKFVLITASYILLALSLKIIQNNKYIYSAFAAHIIDIISTYLVLPNGKELNPVTNFFINKLGVLGGLTATKVLIIGSTSFYALKNFNEMESEIFFKLLIIIGASMASRNLLI